LTGYVILATPSKVGDYRKSLRIGSMPSSFFVDEAGLIKFIDFTSILTFNVTRLWTYGDYEQFAPWEDGSMVQLPEDRYYARAAKSICDAGSVSIHQWMKDMCVPEERMMESRRVPPADAKAIIPHFYDNAANWARAAEWFKTVTLDITGVKTTCTGYVPPSLHQYPYMSVVTKEKEASRLFRFLYTLTEYLKDHNMNDWDVTFVTPYTHLKCSIEETIDRCFPDLKNNVTSCLTARKSQGKTRTLVVSYLPKNPGLFIDDRTLLVSWSRHTTKLIVSGYSLNNLVTKPVLVRLWFFGVIDLDFVRHVNKFSEDAPLLVKVRVRDHIAVRYFFSTLSFEVTRMLGVFCSLDDESRDNFIRSKVIEDEKLYSYPDIPLLCSKGKGKYKHALLMLEKSTFYFDANKKNYPYVDMDGKFVKEKCRYSMPVTVMQKNKQNVTVKVLDRNAASRSDLRPKQKGPPSVWRRKEENINC